MAVQATFQSMGLWSKKAVSAHLLLENAHESSLVSDISKVDYLAGNLGRTHLRPLPGLPTFVDDVYVFGYLRCEDCVVHGGRLSCTTREDSSAKNTFRGYLPPAADGTTCGHIQTNIFHTLATRDNAVGSAIRVSLQDRVRHQQKGAGEVARAVPGDRTGRSLRGKSGCVGNPYGRVASLLASLQMPAVGPRLLPLLYRLHTRFLVGPRPGCARVPLLRFRRLPRARRPGLRHACRRAHDIGEHRQRWGPCLHMGAHKQSWVQGLNEVVQQGCVELRGGRGPQAHWPTMPTVGTCICAIPSCIPMYRTGAALASKSLCTPAAGGPLGGHGQGGGGGDHDPGLPLRSAGGTRPVCGPATRQAVGEPGCVPRPVPCPG